MGSLMPASLSGHLCPSAGPGKDENTVSWFTWAPVSFAHIFWLSSTLSQEGPWVSVRLDPWLKEPPLTVASNVGLMLDWEQ